MSEPQFEVGMIVSTELDSRGTDFRWNYINDPITGFHTILVDNGYSGNMIEGYVEKIDIDLLIMTVNFENNSFFNYPLLGHTAYKKDQWSLPGFLVIKKANKTSRKCSCGSDKTYGSSNGSHSSWCDKYYDY